jgi:competence protein ComEA
VASGSARSANRRRLGIGAIVVVVIVALAVTVLIGMLRPAAPAEVVAVPTPTAAEVFVHVSGAVREPGLYRLPDGARVVDAVAAAGGFGDDADRDTVNLARLVTDGEQLVIGTPPAPGEAAPVTPTSAPAGGLVNLNTATAADLDTLPRVGPAIAQRILDWRDANGRFTSVEDLLAVPGIGDKMLESLRDLVTV